VGKILSAEFFTDVLGCPYGPMCVFGYPAGRISTTCGNVGPPFERGNTGNTPAGQEWDPYVCIRAVFPLLLLKE